MPPRRIAPTGATLGSTSTMNPAIRRPNNRPARAARPVAQPGLDKAPVVPASPPATPQIEHIKKHASRFKCGGEIAPALQIKSQLFNVLRGVESNEKAAHLPFFHASTFAARVTRDRRSKCAAATLRLREFSDPENRPNSSCKFPQLVAIFPADSRRNTKNDFPAEFPQLFPRRRTHCAQPLCSRRARGNPSADGARNRPGNPVAGAGPRRSRVRRLRGVLLRPHGAYARFQKARGDALHASHVAGMRYPRGAPAYLPNLVLRLAEGRGHAR